MRRQLRAVCDRMKEGEKKKCSSVLAGSCRKRYKKAIEPQTVVSREPSRICEKGQQEGAMGGQVDDRRTGRRAELFER